MSETNPEQLTKQSWAPLTLIRPSLQGGKMIIYNCLLRKKAAIKTSSLQTIIRRAEGSEHLQEKLAEIGLLNNQNVSDEELEGIQHWQKRNWVWSLPLYLASCNVTYQDRHDCTAEIREKTLREYLESDGEPPAPQERIERIELPEPKALPASGTLGDILMNRSTKRLFIEGLTPQELSDTFWYGLKEVRNCRNNQSNIIDILKSYGVAFDMYLAVYDLKGFEPGLYAYNMMSHTLSVVQLGNYRELMVDILMGQTPSLTAGITVFVTADFRRYQWRYRHERALRNLYVESGRIVQKLLMVGAQYQMGGLTTPAIKDRKISELLNLDNVHEQVLYSLTMGKIES